MSAYVPANLSAIGLEKYLHEKIPLTRTMAMHVARCDSERLVLEAPLDANSNHLGTAFGGSLHALPMLACYSVLWRVLKEGGVDGHVVVKRSSANYREPVQGLLRATCVCPSAELVAEFLSHPLDQALGVEIARPGNDGLKRSVEVLRGQLANRPNIARAQVADNRIEEALRL